MTHCREDARFRLGKTILRSHFCVLGLRQVSSDVEHELDGLEEVIFRHYSSSRACAPGSRQNVHLISQYVAMRLFRPFCTVGWTAVVPKQDAGAPTHPKYHEMRLTVS